MEEGGESHLTNGQLLPGTLCIYILTHGHPAIVNLLGEGLSFRSKYIQYKITVVAFFTEERSVMILRVVSNDEH